MINLQIFFKNHFDTKEISDDKMKKFTQDHLQKLIANNINNRYDSLITETATAYNSYFGAITDEDTAHALQQSRTITVDNLMKQFTTTVSQKEGAIKSQWGIKSAEYQEFFPLGVSEYTNATKTNIETLMDRFTKASQKYATLLGNDFKNLFTSIYNQYLTARTTQLNQIGIVKTEKSETASNRDEIENQLMKNVLLIAAEHIGQPDKVQVYFNQSIIRTAENETANSQTQEADPSVLN